MSPTDLGILATQRFTERPQIACPAAHEYVRRGVRNTKSEAVKVVVAYCLKQGYAADGRKPAAAKPAVVGTAPPVGRYTCLRVGFTENSPASDLILQSGDRYTVAGAGGGYAYDSVVRTLTWTTGPFATVKTNWVGVFAPAGQGAKVPTIIIRDRKDVAAGNKRDLQWCNQAD